MRTLFLFGDASFSVVCFLCRGLAEQRCSLASRHKVEKTLREQVFMKRDFSLLASLRCACCRRELESIDALAHKHVLSAQLRYLAGTRMLSRESSQRPREEASL